MDNRVKEIIAYLFFGALTTLINIISYGICNIILEISIFTSNVIAWLLSVLFAYITNRKFVFRSTKRDTQSIGKECISFFLGRLSTGIFDTLFMVITVSILSCPNLVMKVSSNIIVIILNYVISKLIIFKSPPTKRK